MKNIIIMAVVLILIAGGAYYLIQITNDSSVSYEKPEVATLPETSSSSSTEPASEAAEVETSTEDPTPEREAVTQIGTSVEGRAINAYHFGTGKDELLLIGGIHGGYSWNTARLAYELIDWFESDTSAIPDNVTVTIIPTLNPDGLYDVTGKDGVFVAADVKGSTEQKVAARFNANTVDLNRNFDCEWKQSGTWQDRTVSGGTTPFSEPETQALRDYVADHEPAQVIAWYSSAGGVYASQCGGSTLSATRTLTNTFATAAGYTAYEEFDYYAITGDMVNWFAKLEVPAISVLLSTHESTELNKNRAGVEAVLSSLAD
jgi:hypothetical protein